MADKISEYPAKTVFNDDDLIDISTSIEGGASYVSEKSTLLQVVDYIKTKIIAIYRPDGGTAWVGEDFSKLRLNPTDRVYLDKPMWISETATLAAAGQPSLVNIGMTSTSMTIKTRGALGSANGILLFTTGNTVTDPTGLTKSLYAFRNGTTDLFNIKANGVLNCQNMPTSATGLVSGDIYSNSGVLTIV